MENKSENILFIFRLRPPQIWQCQSTKKMLESPEKYISLNSNKIELNKSLSVSVPNKLAMEGFMMLEKYKTAQRQKLIKVFAKDERKTDLSWERFNQK